MLKVGITGGIGSGKSHICKIFNDLYKIPIYNSDDEAKKISNLNPTIISTLKEWYGEDIYLGNEVDRPKLANIIFNNKEELQKVNSLFHPILEKDFLEWSKQYRNLPYVLFECAVLFENGLEKNVDISINVHSILPTKVHRVIMRDNTTAEKIMERMKNQLSDPELDKLSDITIMNEDYDDIYKQIRKINNNLLTLDEITQII
jgi:dephospho-CoA kinase